MFTKLDIFLEGLESLTAFPAPKPNEVSYTPTFPDKSFGWALSSTFYFFYFSFWIKLLFSISLTADL